MKDAETVGYEGFKASLIEVSPEVFESLRKEYIEHRQSSLHLMAALPPDLTYKPHGGTTLLSVPLKIKYGVDPDYINVEVVPYKFTDEEIEIYESYNLK